MALLQNHPIHSLPVAHSALLAGHKLQAAVADMPVSTQQSSSSAADFAMEGQCFACVCPFEEDSEALDLAALKDYLQARNY